MDGIVQGGKAELWKDGRIWLGLGEVGLHTPLQTPIYPNTPPRYPKKNPSTRWGVTLRCHIATALGRMDNATILRGLPFSGRGGKELCFFLL